MGPADRGQACSVIIHFEMMEAGKWIEVEEYVGTHSLLVVSPWSEGWKGKGRKNHVQLSLEKGIEHLGPTFKI